MKKLLSIVLAAIMVLSLAACGSSESSSKANKGSSDSGEKVYKIGVMQFGEFTALQNAYNGFVDGLADAGYKDGENIEITYLSAAADTANCPTIADTLINNKSDLIFAIATPSISSVKQKTTEIPVLYTAVTDPVGSGIVESNDGSGTNIAGTSDMNPVKEQIDLIVKLVPSAKTIAVMYCSSESNSAAQYELAKKEIEALGLTCVQKTVSAIDEAKSAIESLKGVADAIYIPTDNTLADGMTLVAAAANDCKIPVVPGEPGMVENGGLATYGIDYYQLGKQTAEMAVEILQSENPVETAGKMPTGYQTKECMYAINSEEAALLGISVPDDIAKVATFY